MGGPDHAAAAAVVLASGSATRRALLEAAGVAVTVDPPELDEAAAKRQASADGLDIAAAAIRLAGLKAQAVSRRHPGAPVIGADQMLDCEGVWFDKPADAAGAAAQLRALRGRTHRLVSAVVLAEDGRILWSHAEAAEMTMRPFSDDFLAGYLRKAGPAVLGAVGTYQLEGLGAQLFERIAGDHFTILGLPLLPLLAALRQQGILQS